MEVDSTPSNIILLWKPWWRYYVCLCEVPTMWVGDVGCPKNRTDCAHKNSVFIGSSRSMAFGSHCAVDLVFSCDYYYYFVLGECRMGHFHICSRLMTFGNRTWNGSEPKSPQTRFPHKTTSQKSTTKSHHRSILPFLTSR